MHSTPRLPAIRIIPHQIQSATFNMAADEWLLSLEQPVLRFYGWTKPTLSFGRSNVSAKDLNLRACSKPTIEKVRRKTGGKTVLHHLELTYSFACESSLFPRSILETYRLISQPLADTFSFFGLTPEMKNVSDKSTESTICFKETSAYEITLDGRKIVGSAQYKKRKRFLQHGSILLAIDWPLWKSIWNIPPDSTVLERRITCLQDHIEQLPETALLTEQLEKAFGRFFQTTTCTHPFDPSEIKQIRLLEETYQWSGFDDF